VSRAGENARMGDFDVVIVGAGIAGASLAWRLADRRSVLVLEAESQPGYHATGRSAAMFMESYGPPGVRALTRASRRFFEAPPEGFADGPLLTPRGALYVATVGQAELLRGTHAELAPGCPGLEHWDAAATLAHVPCLRADGLIGALYDPDAQDLDVHALHQGFLRGLRARGGRIATGAPLAAARHDGTRWTLQLGDGETVGATRLVNAAGAWADAVAALCGIAPVGLEPRRRSAFTFKAPAGVDSAAWPAVVGVDEGWYFKPDAGRLLGSPANADPTVPHDVRPEELDIAIGIDRIQTVTTLEIRRPESTWAGLRSFVADGELVIGAEATQPAFFWLAAQGGYGIQSAAGASALAAALLCGEPVPDDLLQHGVDATVFSPRRLR
jgi:D-arginine dehydrogenase